MDETARRDSSPLSNEAWRPTACILCECNCGIEVELGGDDGRRFGRLRGDRAHPESRGYVCQKAGRLDHYQNSRDRILAPLRRQDDGTFEEISWQTAISEIAEKLASVRDRFGGETILYYGGGGQGNHLPGGYARSTRAALGMRYRSNALAQEKTGEFWVHHQMFGSGPARGDFQSCEVALFLGKNPWQSHGIPRARVTLREIAKDPERALIVVDVVRTETADLADHFLQVRPGTDAWLLLAMLGVLLEEELVDAEWVSRHTAGFEGVRTLLDEARTRVDVASACGVCGVPEEQVRAIVRRIAKAESVSVFEDLGVQMNRHSTLVSWLERLLWVLTGNFAKPGAHNVSTALVPLAPVSRSGPQTSPVVEAPVIGGLIPCNVIAEEILTDHPKRFRAMFVESANPVHSLADSKRMREALRALELVVVVDVAFSETAREADYVLPATTQYEKAEATFFNFGFPHNAFHLRHPLLAPPEGPLPEPEIHARLAEALGVLPAEPVEKLKAALAVGGRPAFASVFASTLAEDPRLAPMAPALLYRTLGPTLPAGLESAAALWGIAHTAARLFPDSIRRAGIEGEGPTLGETLFDAMLRERSGFVFSEDAPEVSWERLGTPDRRIQLAVPDLVPELEQVLSRKPDGTSSNGDGDEYPFLLSAGERRSFTANTINRDPDWRRKDREGALRVSPDDAQRLGLDDGGEALLTTRRGAARVVVEVSDRMQPGHLSLPNGLGLDYPAEKGDRQLVGVAPNELTSLEDRDPIAGTPWHKGVPARLEAAVPARAT